VYFKQQCDVSAKYTLVLVGNQTLNKTSQKSGSCRIVACEERLIMCTEL